MTPRTWIASVLAAALLLLVTHLVWLSSIRIYQLRLSHSDLRIIQEREGATARDISFVLCLAGKTVASETIDDGYLVIDSTDACLSADGTHVLLLPTDEFVRWRIGPAGADCYGEECYAGAFSDGTDEPRFGESPDRACATDRVPLRKRELLDATYFERVLILSFAPCF